MWAWIISHSAIVSAAGVALLDFVFAVSPGVASNGILHAIYNWLKGSKPAA